MFFCPEQQIPDWDNILRVMKQYWKEAQEHYALVLLHMALIRDSYESFFSYLFFSLYTEISFFL